MDIQSIFEWLQATPFSTMVRENGLLFPVVESIHVLTIAFVVGSIALVDLRLLGVNAFNRSVRRLMSDVLPLTWAFFGCAVLTGAILFSSDAVAYSQNIPFRLKLVFLGMTAINVLIFHLLTCRTVVRWDETLRTPPAARLGGAASLLLWASITACGRWIAFAA